MKIHVVDVYFKSGAMEKLGMKAAQDLSVTPDNIQVLTMNGTIAIYMRENVLKIELNQIQL